MKRILVVFGTAATMVLLVATTALAQYPPTSAPPPGGSHTDPSSTLPFTGANLSWGFILLGALVITGVVLLFSARRRSRV
jgi:LPXTG-motif cell wall-anchored protein